MNIIIQDKIEQAQKNYDKRINKVKHKNGASPTVSKNKVDSKFLVTGKQILKGLVHKRVGKMAGAL